MTDCTKCDGIGFTLWAAFAAGCINLVAQLWGEHEEPAPCTRCKGTGEEP